MAPPPTASGDNLSAEINQTDRHRLVSIDALLADQSCGPQKDPRVLEVQPSSSLTSGHYWLNGLIALTLLAWCLPILLGARAVMTGSAGRRSSRAARRPAVPG